MRQAVFNDERVGAWVAKKNGGMYTGGVAMGMEDDGELIAGVWFEQYNMRSIAMHVAIDNPRALTPENLRICFDYPFRQLKVKKIIGYVDSSNRKAQLLDEYLGFVKEAVIRDAGKFGDLIIYTMTPEQCRFLGTKHGQ